MDFVLVLHSHLPYVLHHGRWPHGSDWLCEAALDTYLPLLEELRALREDRVPSPVSIGFTPVLANQLADAEFAAAFEEFLAHRFDACDTAARSLTATGAAHLLPLVPYWRARFERLAALYRSMDGDLCGAFRALEDDGVIEILTSAATHGYLPLLARDESIQLQLAVGAAEHRRIFGRSARGLWLPECAYRPGGAWTPTDTAPARSRVGIEGHVASAGFQYFVVDAHLAAAGDALGSYVEVPLGAERFDAERRGDGPSRAVAARRSPYHAYDVGGVAALVRDPASSVQVWSRHQGYPGDEWYLEFHKIRWPDGLRFWRVSGPQTDLGSKHPYEPSRAVERAHSHAAHFAGLLDAIARRHDDGTVIVAPFDTELFGHWWHEGVRFVGSVYRTLAAIAAVQPRAASDHLERQPPRARLRLAAGSWGANGDDSMWLNPETRWMWERLWPLEEAFWDRAPHALAQRDLWPILTQAARELLLAQSSDWPFIISTGAVPDYGAQRFALHCDDLERLLPALEPEAGYQVRAGAAAEAERLEQRDAVFPDVLESVRAVVRDVQASHAG
jgi:1,4-alpha-glucan branching enzyme